MVRPIVVATYLVALPNMPPHLTADGERAIMNVSGLAGGLERDPAVRAHLRSPGEVRLFEENIQDCVKHACFDHVHGLLVIMLHKTVAVETMPQPPIHPLRDEIRALYKLCGRSPEDSTIIHDSWMIRKFLGLVKMKTRKEKVSTDPRPHICGNKSSNHSFRLIPFIRC